MKRAIQGLSGLYRHLIGHPFLLLVLVLLVTGVFAFASRGFYYDASADSLVAEKDPELLYYRQVSHTFGGEDFLFLTYTPKFHAVFTPETLTKLDSLAKQLAAVPGVSKVTSILDAPLLQSPPVPLTEMAHGYRTLRSPDVDLKAAFTELTTSPLFKNLLVSEDGTTTAIRIDLAQDPHLKTLADKRNALRLLPHPTSADKTNLQQINAEYRQAYAANVKALEGLLNHIRAIRDQASTDATVYLGGVPMIASDMMHYVKNDMLIFGVSCVLLMMVALYAFFRKLRWVFLPMLVTAISIICTIGLLGMLHKPVTVISSNFVPILVILAISIVVHLATRYREVLEKHPQLSCRDILHQTMVDKFAPTLYATLTTVAGFASLCTSSIVPVVDFGLIMCVGVVIAFVVAYAVFPVMLQIIPRKKLTEPTRDNCTPLVRHAYRLSRRKTNGVLLVALGVGVLTAWGMSRLSLENRFLDYFKTNTEIHQGLAFIDQEMGGTIPMDIILQFPPYHTQQLASTDDFYTEDADPYPQRYWFTPDKIDLLRKVGTYLDQRPEVGKVISLATLEEIAQSFNDGKPLSSVELVAVLGALPDAVRQEFITPYASPETGMMRISTRIHETGPRYPRDKLIADIKAFGTQTLGLPEGQLKVTGVNVLFNGMLKELFSSQTSTLGFVLAATFMMFWILLRSWRLAVIGVLPNTLAAFSMLGFMGFAGIPLDMMTITIAAIVVGIGVDDAIHYLHHFNTCYQENPDDVDEAVRRSHREIGRAMYFTTLTVIIGFSVLCFSNFIPTVYFGLLTALAMVLALLANLTILPTLLLKFYR